MNISIDEVKKFCQRHANTSVEQILQEVEDALARYPSVSRKALALAVADQPLRDPMDLAAQMSISGEVNKLVQMEPNTKKGVFDTLENECAWVHDLTKKLMQVTEQAAEQAPDGPVKQDVLAKVRAVCGHLMGSAHCLTVGLSEAPRSYQNMSVSFDAFPSESPAQIDPELLEMLEAPHQPNTRP